MKKLITIFTVITYLLIGSNYTNAQGSIINIAVQLEEQLKDLELLKDKIPEYSYFVKRQKDIVSSINKEYSKIAMDIANSVLKKAPKTDKDFEKKHPASFKAINNIEGFAKNLYEEIGEKIDSVNNQEKYAKIYADWNSVQSIIDEILVGLLSISPKLKAKVKAVKCNQAANFYKKVRWRTPKEINNNNYDINWEQVLGTDDAKILKKTRIEAE